MLAIPVTDKVYIFTDHSCIIFLKDGTPCESILLDNSDKDAGICNICICSEFFNSLFADFWMDTLFIADEEEILAFD